MIPHFCIVKHDPPNSYGDCLRAAVASILNIDVMETVPHFMESGNDEQSQEVLRTWLAERGLKPFYSGFPATTRLEDIYSMMAGVNPDINYLLFCQANQEGDHVVICRNDKMIHDPAWVKASTLGPGTNGMWVVGVFVPIL